MGLYATTTSISELMPNYLDGNTTTGDTAGTNIWSRHIDRAEAKVNSFIVNRYSLPFTTVPPLIRKLAEDITCRLALRGAYVQDGQRRQEILDDYDEALITLREIRDGKTKLALTDGSLAPSRSTNRILSNTKNYTPIFGLDSEQNWKRDTDEVTDQDNSRNNG